VNHEEGKDSLFTIPLNVTVEVLPAVNLSMKSKFIELTCPFGVVCISFISISRHKRPALE